MTSMEADPKEYEQLVAEYKNKDIAECFARMHLGVQKELSNIRSSVAGLEGRVTELEKFATHANTEITNAPGKVDQLINDEKNERLKLELWTRKWNLVIMGVKGPNREGSRDSAKAVKSFLKSVLALPAEIVDPMHFQACHRLQGGKEGTKNIIVRFVDLADRDDVLNAATKLQPGSGYSVIPDLPPQLSQLRSSLLKKRWNMPPDEKKKTKLVYLKEYPFLQLKTK